MRTRNMAGRIQYINHSHLLLSMRVCEIATLLYCHQADPCIRAFANCSIVLVGLAFLPGSRRSSFPYHRRHPARCCSVHAVGAAQAAVSAGSPLPSSGGWPCCPPLPARQRHPRPSCSRSAQAPTAQLAGRRRPAMPPMTPPPPPSSSRPTSRSPPVCAMSASPSTRICTRANPTEHSRRQRGGQEGGTTLVE